MTNANGGLRRKTQLLIAKFSPVYDTHNEVIRKKLEPGKFPQTKTGIIKMLVISIHLASIISWCVLGQKCINLGISYSFISCLCVGFSGELFLFLIFSFGKSVKDPAFWIYGDIIFTFIVSLLTIITSVLSIKICNKDNDVAENLYQSLAISGAVMGILSCAALFLMYRFVEEPEEVRGLPRRAAVKDPRKSVFA